MPIFSKNLFPPLNKNNNPENEGRETPIWPSRSNKHPETSSISEIMQLIKGFLQNFDLQKIFKNLKTLMSGLAAAPDATSKLKIAIDFVISILSP